MCTLTIVPHEDGLQIGCNRDERPDRGPALGPSVHRIGRLRAVFPVDVRGAGTWIGVNETGLVAAVLNRTEAGDRPAVAALRCSRGTVGRHVLGAADLETAIHAVTTLPLRAFDAFTLVVARGCQAATITNDGFEYGVSVQTITGPLCFTSSSLGDTLVREPRLLLFDRAVKNARAPLLMQRPFHHHHWPDRPHVSVSMRRRDAATVSRTWISVGSDRAILTYEPLDGPAAGQTLLFRGAGCTSSPPSSSRHS